MNNAIGRIKWKKGELFCLMHVSVSKQGRIVDIIGKKCFLFTSEKDFCNA